MMTCIPTEINEVLLMPKPVGMHFGMQALVLDRTM